MNTHSVLVPFEGEQIELKLPGSWEILGKLEPTPLDGVDDLSAALHDALDNPIESPPLAEMDLADKRIVLAVDDFTRPTPLCLFFGDLLGYLERHGAKRENMLVLPALGVHRDMTRAEMERKLGADNLKNLRWVNHNCRDLRENVTLGITTRGTQVALNKHLREADLIICVGAVEPHPLLGFGGGLKMIIPGLAHMDTIQQNHMQGVSARKYNYIGSIESPMRLDLEEGAQMLGKPFFIVNAVMNHELVIGGFVCGDPIKAHREGVKTAESINARDLEAPADVAIVVSNPLNADLRQGMKSLANAEPCLKEHGLLVGILECRNGIGDVSLPAKALPNGVLRFILRILGGNRVLWFIDKIKKDAGVEERFMAHFSMQVVRKNKIMIFSRKLPPETGKKIGLFAQFGDPDEMIRAAAKYAPRKARVYVYPYGGVTYPRPSWAATQ
jgi:nickel-dependent lactate racemase